MARLFQLNVFANNFMLPTTKVQGDDMAKGKARLNKISDPGQSDVIEKMKLQGWRVTKTQNGHLRLDHDNAVRPVFASSTPSCSYAHLKVESDCKRALRGAEPQVNAAPMPTPVVQQPIPKDKARWTEADRSVRETPVVAKIEHEPAPEAETVNAAPPPLFR